MASSASTSPRKDWSAAQYLKFADERTRAVHDLVARVPLPGGRFPATDATPSLRIVDLGCGPGNSTAVLAARFPGARLEGVDASPDMLVTARAALPAVPFVQADLRAYAAPADPPADLLLANAVFQWLPLAERLPAILRLVRSLRPGGVLAYQVPDNKAEPSHRAMGEVARGQHVEGDAPWTPYLASLVDRDPIETPEQIYDALAPHCAAVDIWHTHYHHVLPGGPAAIVEWVKGTGLQPWLHALPDDDPALRVRFLAAYQARLAHFYTPRVDGSVLLRYPRLFVVAVRK